METEVRGTPETTDENEGALPPGIMEGEPRFSGEGELSVRGQTSSGGSIPPGPTSHSGMINLFG